MAFVHSSAPPCIVTDVTGVAKLITGIRSDLNIFLAGSLYIGEHRAKRIRRCWRKLHHGSPTISVWGCPMGSAARLTAERSTCGTATGAVPFFLLFFFLDSLTLNHTAALKSRICDHDGMLCLLGSNRQKRNLRHDFDLSQKYLMTVGSGGVLWVSGGVLWVSSVLPVRWPC